ncbi:hypothetical protein BpHYR1_000822 [Brachionus plicatilis]|uniref:Uncharacterized protein n=1 Tax=Brachionus plicatilis TaxID=10195 RepID=A0A3M7P3B2_BRAPC|nr:hypothetical protein BpHYR1_000822 [Brachionus plicatilis]
MCFMVSLLNFVLFYNKKIVFGVKTQIKFQVKFNAFSKSSSKIMKCPFFIIFTKRNRLLAGSGKTVKKGFFWDRALDGPIKYIKKKDESKFWALLMTQKW